jgi:hypothetical protein
MIWHSVLNSYPETHCKCEVLMPREDGDIDQYDADYDMVIGMFLIPTLIKEDGLKGHVSHWRAL